jgi:hypothetical protein
MRYNHFQIPIAIVAIICTPMANSLPTSCWVGYGSAALEQSVDPSNNYLCACYKFSCDGSIPDVSACSDSEKSSGSEIWAFSPQTFSTIRTMLNEPDTYIELNACGGTDNCNAPTHIYCGGGDNDSISEATSASAMTVSVAAATMLVSATIVVIG